MRLVIHRGAHQIGGTCIEIESQGSRLVLDIGQPLDSPDAESAVMPSLEGLENADGSLLGVILSHPHLDHYGLASRLPKNTTFLMGEATERVLAAAAVFTPAGGIFKNVTHLADRDQIILGPFTITPFLVDHSAYDSYALLIQSAGQSVFYTGDLRAHGRKAALFEKMIQHPPAGVKVLLMEGTTISRSGTDRGFPTETDLEKQMVTVFEETDGMPLVWCSGQNIDRIVTIYRAAKRANRQLIIDMYTAQILKATWNQRIPQADWNDIRVFLPEFQKRRIKRLKRFDISDQYKSFRVYPEQMADAASSSVMLFRPSMQIDVEKAGCFTGACLIYSMWDGYLADEQTKPFLKWLNQHEIPLCKCHTSGHASLRDLKRLRSAFESAVVVPVHCAEPEIFAHAFARVELHVDNEWWEIK